jgi:hypothetical protein
MPVIRNLALAIVVIYLLVAFLLFLLQTRLIFYPGKLTKNFQFKTRTRAEELFLTTSDGQTINGLFFRKSTPNVILYFHGNAGDLSGWQYVADDFSDLPYSFLIIDYRGYGKSSGRISEGGFYLDAQAAFDYLVQAGFSKKNILIYGRSIGSGVAVDLASKNECKGLILESPYSSLPNLANEKLPFLFPSLYLRYRFDNIKKIRGLRCPVVLLHGSDDTLIPVTHSRRLFEKCTSKKKMIIVENGAHNDLHAFEQYEGFLKQDLHRFFEGD